MKKVFDLIILKASLLNQDWRLFYTRTVCEASFVTDKSQLESMQQFTPVTP